MVRKVTQIIEDQFRSWRHHNSRNPSGKPKNKSYPVITISREFGARGAALAEIMGGQIGFKVWDKQLLQAIAKELDSKEEQIETVDERRRKPVEDAMMGFMKRKHTNVNYLLSLIRVVNTIEDFGNSIIVGRGASYICQDASSFHIRVVCPLKMRISGYARRENISKEEAHRIIDEKDSERADFVLHSFNKDVNNAADYDLILNSGTFDLEDLADIAVNAYEITIGRPVTGKITHGPD
ncbi:MAG: cytidylate kinase-like family protein [Balneolaceae bacterium]|nr:cytidylate kinase-like family protein [Balneolaceae bacterium]